MSAPDIKVVRTFSELRDALAPRAGGALRESETADIFCTLAWFENLASHGLDQDSAAESNYLLFAKNPTDGSALCLPLLSGKDLASMSNYYSGMYGPVGWTPAGSAEAASALPALQSICKHLRQRRPPWPAIMLSPLDTQAPFFDNMEAALGQAGFWVDRYFCFGNWYLEVANRSFDAYFPSLPAALRNSISRGQRKLGREGAWHIHIQQSEPASLEASIADFVSVYERSWKPPEPNPQFIPSMARLAAAQGWLRLGVLKLNGQAIAAQLWLVKGSKANIYKLAYAKGFERFSVGSVLTQALMQHVIDVDQVQEVDYLSGDDAYKRDWMSSRRERWGLMAFNTGTARGLWQCCKHVVAKRLRQWKLL